MKYATVCSGVEAPSVAWKCLGWKPVWFSQFDPEHNYKNGLDFPSEVLRQRFPDVPNLGDMTKIRNSEIYNGSEFELLIGGTPCFVAGTLITTKRGHIPIEDVEVGDEVLTHNGKWEKVIKIGSKTNAKTREIRGMGFLPTRTTDEHPYFCSKKGRVWNNDKRMYERTFSELEWVDAKDILEGEHFASQVLPKEESIDGDNDFWWIVGRYIADGWLRNRKSRNNGRFPDYVLICCGKHEKDELAERIARKFHASVSEERTTFRFQIANKNFAKFLEEFGRGAKNKEIPPKYYGLSKEQAKSFLDGYFSGDGYQDERVWSATTISSKLTIGLSILIQRAYGIIASIQETNVPEFKEIEGRTVRQSKFYQVGFRTSKKGVEYHIEDKYGLKPIRLNRATGQRETVYNLEVANDNSYVANGNVVHNCQSFSIAGLRNGLDDERGNLALEFCRILRDKKPTWFIWENVPGVLSSGKGKTSKQSLERLPKSGMAFRGEFLTLNSSEFPNDVKECLLSDILETGDHLTKYSLSPKACAGIIKRALKRKKKIPEILLKSLLMQSGKTTQELMDEAGIVN